MTASSETLFPFVADAADELPPPLHATFWVGEPAWGHRLVFGGFERTPMICVGAVADPLRWSADDDFSAETWIYFRARHEWEAAWRLARILMRERGAHPAWRCVGHDQVFAYKPPLEEVVVVNRREICSKGYDDWHGHGPLPRIVPCKP